jgi:hypothetical protein
VFSETLSAEGAVVFAKACELGLEGIVSKREGSFYRSGHRRPPTPRGAELTAESDRYLWRRSRLGSVKRAISVTNCSFYTFVAS